MVQLACFHLDPAYTPPITGGRNLAVEMLAFDKSCVHTADYWWSQPCDEKGTPLCILRTHRRLLVVATAAAGDPVTWYPAYTPPITGGRNLSERATLHDRPCVHTADYWWSQQPPRPGLETFLRTHRRLLVVATTARMWDLGSGPAYTPPITGGRNLRDDLLLQLLPAYTPPITGGRNRAGCRRSSSGSCVHTADYWWSQRYLDWLIGQESCVHTADYWWSQPYRSQPC